MLEAVVRHQLPYYLGLFERNTDVLPLLHRNLETAIAHSQAELKRIEVVEGDFCQTAVDWIARNVRPWMLGLMIVDVNSVFDSPEVRSIAARSELKRVDVALHLPAGIGKWPERKHRPSTVDDLRAAFKKQHWQVALSRGNYQWTRVLARTIPACVCFASAASSRPKRRLAWLAWTNCG